MIEFSRRHDGAYNVWELQGDCWVVVSVAHSHDDAVAAVRTFRTQRRSDRVAA